MDTNLLTKTPIHGMARKVTCDNVVFAEGVIRKNTRPRNELTYFTALIFKSYLVELPPRPLGVPRATGSTLLSWTVVDDGDMIQVRASINAKTEPREITRLIDALVKRAASPLQTAYVTGSTVNPVGLSRAQLESLNKEKNDERPDA
jgi:hypothetical protein